MMVGTASITGVPKPVTASQPTAAGNPGVSQPIEDPVVMSVSAAKAPPYIHGFRNLRAGLPAAMSASFTRAMIAAKVGPDALVPPIVVTLPS